MSEEYKIVVIILENQEKLTLTLIINHLMKEYRKNVIGNEGSLSKMMMTLLTNQRGKDQSKSKSGQKGKSASETSNSSQSLSEQCIHCIKKSHDESKY